MSMMAVAGERIKRALPSISTQVMVPPMFNRPLSARIVPLLLIVTGEVPALMLVMPPLPRMSAPGVLSNGWLRGENQTRSRLHHP